MARSIIKSAGEPLFDADYHPNLGVQRGEKETSKSGEN
jgi:hypothetical protein